VVHTEGAFAIPAGLPHRVLAMEGPLGGVAHLDVRRYRFEDAAALAETWRGFVPGRDQLTEAFGDTLRLPPRRVAPRLLRALDALEGASVASVAAQVGLSASRLTHLVTDALGAALLGHGTLTHAAHEAELADSAHLTRTCKSLMGVRPAEMLPPTIYLSREG
jgi:AraC-like DNA-binding protein